MYVCMYTHVWLACLCAQTERPLETLFPSQLGGEWLPLLSSPMSLPCPPVLGPGLPVQIFSSLFL